MNKGSGGDGIPAELSKVLKDDALKFYTQYGSKFGKLSSGHRTGKGQFSFQFQRKAMPKNAQTTAQLPSLHTLVGFYPWVGKFLCRREWQFTPVFLSGELHGQRSLVGYSLGGSKRVRHD